MSKEQNNPQIKMMDGGSDAIGAAMPAESGVGGIDTDALVITGARELCERLIGPNAQSADRAAGPLVENFRALAEARLLGIALPQRFGGLDAPGAVQRLYTETLASYCGVTTFVQAQHHGSSRMIANGPNESLKQMLVPDLAAGRQMCAISFAHLRRPGPPTLSIHPVDGGYRLNGAAPWVTGWGLMRQVVFGATLPDGRFAYVWSPGSRGEFPELFDIREPTSTEWGELSASVPIPLCAMNASATVALHLKNWFIPADHLLSESDRETMDRNDRNGVLGATAMPLGCAAAGLRILCDTAERRPIPAIRRAADSLTAELAEVRSEVEFWSTRNSEPEFFENALFTRAWCIELALRVAQASITAVSGSANSLDHPAQRLLREAMFYSIQAQTREVMSATLERLERTSTPSSRRQPPL